MRSEANKNLRSDFLVIFLIGNLYSLTGEQYKLANAFLLAGVLCSYALTIVVLKRRY
ncbi:hypothetical protein GH868_09665 [Bacillus thuringiensis]|nr:conserved hypothetical protein [Bacillus cereus NVH0597-99]MRA70896.1 hypothetical protein [Bacillus thuringiensis]MRA90307.1 hypothetical protein [Bacillus thuringiensis]MRB23661.1 hypothetical protein [Bacillus thuringiensis]MRC52857.1 hypothetical protein [Bacillus thuringiensis]